MKKYFSLKMIVCSIAILMLAKCKVPYDPPLKSTKVNYLVVEGYIDGAALTTIKLSRTRQLSAGDTAATKVETRARVFVEDEHQNQYGLSETGNGIYVSSGVLNLNPAFQYRLHIFTVDGKEYLSDLVPFKNSPPIDDIGLKIKNDDAQVYVSTHDQNNNTKYYRWEYDETWEFHSTFNTMLRYDAASNKVVPRTDQVHVCWNYAKFSKILLASSAKLSGDVINEMPLVYVPQHDKKLSVLYSILVKQYALDVSGYNYWEAMKSNTESVGSIFDPQPNQTVGNIHCTSDASEVVVGYIGAGNSYTKRVFIPNSAVPANWNIYPFCSMYPVTEDSLINYFVKGNLSPIAESEAPTGKKVYLSSEIECVDCTISGSNIKPSFWP